MTASTLKALKESIAHWTRLYLGKRNRDEGITGSDCALCKLFAFNGKNCRGCPVRDATGRESCVGSPYAEAQKANARCGLDSPAFKEKALVMLEFLRSLVPDEDNALVRAKLAENLEVARDKADELAAFFTNISDSPALAAGDKRDLRAAARSLQSIRSTANDLHFTYEAAPKVKTGKLKRPVSWR